MDDAPFCCGELVAEKLGRSYIERLSLLALSLPIHSLARTHSLLGHRIAEAVLVKGYPLFGDDLPCHLDRKAVRVVQLEGHLSWEGLCSIICEALDNFL